MSGYLRNSVMAGIVLLSGLAASQSTLLPTVDLGYEIHRASFLNVRLGCYSSFS